MEVTGDRLRIELFPHPGKSRVPCCIYHIDGQQLTELHDLQIVSQDARARFVQELRPDLQQEARDLLQRAAVEVLRERQTPSKNSARDGVRTAAGLLQELEPWPLPVELATVLDQTVERIHAHLSLSAHDACAMALWAAHAHAMDAWQVSPILALVSPEKRCGKSTAMTLVGALAPKPLAASNITAAAIFRTIEALQPTLLIDEADTFLDENEGLRGVLNSGHTRAMAQVLRLVGDEHEPAAFSTWAPKVIAKIGDLPSTLADRSVPIRLRRKQPDDPVAPLRLDRLGALRPIARQLAQWCRDHVDDLAALDPIVPAGLNDRAADNWRPLLAIADAAGRAWPAKARAAAKALTVGEADSSPGVLLLEDLGALFAGGSDRDRLATNYLLERLNEREDRPWPEWRNGRPLSPSAMARLLRPFGVAPKQWRLGDSIIRGYERDSFSEAWSRYCPQVVTAQAVTGQATRYTPKASAANDLGESVTGVTAWLGGSREENPDAEAA